jgi:hypothetical protein
MSFMPLFPPSAARVLPKGLPNPVRSRADPLRQRPLLGSREVYDELQTVAKQSCRKRLCGEHMKPNWLDSYYEALEFFYWEPQHIRPKTPAAAEFEQLAKIGKQSSKVEQFKNHVRKMEVTLNHNIAQFFLLAPDSLRNHLFSELFCHEFDESFEMENGTNDIDKKFALGNCMQPDVLFISQDSVVSIEMKIKSKCSVDQVLKYALLGLAVEIREKRQKKHYLVLLGPGALTTQFPQRFESIDILSEAVRREDLNSFLGNKPRALREQERLQQIVQDMNVHFLSYAGLTSFLQRSVPPLDDRSAGAEVYRKLVGGLCDEISNRRKLA